MYSIYVLRCQDQSLYTGITTDFTRRIRQHCGIERGGAKYTCSHPPTAIACIWETACHNTAARFEIFFKQLSRKEKLALIAAPSDWHTFFPQLADETITPVPPKPLAAFLPQDLPKK
ncbi:MAG: GIY-YIG nuclease family protein [Ruminococcus sp.]|nr:GIY-YIG nuclease family protein [Ruminococcus sp.]